MPSELKRYKVFIASPGGLERERKVFYSVVNQYNIDEAIHRGVFFEPGGWEKVTPGMGRPQSLIDEELKEYDFFVLLLHNKWGSHPGENQHGASSGTEEEYYVALKCYYDNQFPMRELACIFKSISPKQLAVPDEELRKVLDFKMKLESEKKQLYGTFSSAEEFKTLLRSALARWLRAITEGDGSKEMVSEPNQPIESPSIISIIIAEEDESEATSRHHIENAWLLVHKGRITEAEIEFSKAIRITPKTYQLLSYSDFLIESGQLGKAMRLIDQSLRESTSEKRFDRLANTLTLKSRVYYLQGKIEEAELLNRRALRYYLDLRYAEGIATTYQNLGKILLNRGKLLEAEELFIKALDIHNKDKNLSGRADLLESLGNVYRTKGELGLAESYFTKALKLNKGLRQLSREASILSEMGKIKLARGNDTAALRMVTKSLKIYERIGNKRGMATQYGILGNVYFETQKIDLADKYYIKSLNIYRQLGEKVGIAASMGNLGNVFVFKYNLERGEEMYRKSLALYEELKDLRGIATQYQNLGQIHFLREDLETAMEVLNKALEISLKINDQELISNQLGSIGVVYYLKGNFKEAETYYNKSLLIADTHGFKSTSKVIKERLKLL
jgi:tetratricopeptide (TPR) repeat protein